MDIEGLRAWGEVHHYPQLVLERGVLRAGERSWQRFLRQADSERMEQAMRRIERWIAYEQKEEVRVWTYATIGNSVRKPTMKFSTNTRWNN